MENPYYGGIDNVNDTNGNDRVNVLENPYYGGVDSESD